MQQYGEKNAKRRCKRVLSLILKSTFQVFMRFCCSKYGEENAKYGEENAKGGEKNADFLQKTTKRKFCKTA